MRQRSHEDIPERPAALPFFSVALTLAFIPHLMAQQYCVSGPATAVQNCTNCNFHVGDQLAMTVTVLPTSVNCQTLGSGGLLVNNTCSANASIDLNIGNRYWTTRNGANPNSGIVEISSAMALGNVSSGIVFTGSPTSSAIIGPESAVSADFNVSMYTTSIVPNDTLPQTIPTGAALAAGNANQSFMVGGGDGTAIFSYTGQSCATPLPPGPPIVTPSGIVPLFSTATTIQPGSWVSIFGTNLAGAPTTWSPATTFPTSLGGTSVTIDGRSAYLWYVSPGQINLQVPDDNATGSVNVVVTTGGGTVNSTTTLGQFGPSFSLLDAKHVAGIILRNDGSGTQGGGSYDIIGPTGTALGYQTVAAKAGDVVEVFGVGFGPTSPTVPSGQVYSGAAPTTNPVKVMINNVAVTPLFAGITSAGLYQINLAIPAGLGTGDVPLIASVGGVQTPSTVVISLR